jgi:ABC-type Na+ transport system ATPase subunit NatA
MELAATADRMIRLHDGQVVSDENLSHDQQAAAAAA